MSDSRSAWDNDISITDLIPLEKLQQLQDAFALANQVASTLTTIEGTPITRPSNHSRVCTLIRATDKGLFNCIKSGHILGEAALNARKPVHRSCMSVGFTDAAAPIIVNGMHIANWLIGQYHVGDVDERRIAEYAREIGANPVHMVEEFRKMPKHDLKEFEQKLQFLGLMANELSAIAYQKLLQQRQTDELNRTQKQLEVYKDQLESMVSERTETLRKTNEKLTEEIRARAKIQKRQMRLVTAIENAVESIIITSRSGRIIYVNPAFEALTGYSAKEAIGKNPRILRSGYHDDAFYRELWNQILGGEVWFGRFTNRKKDGTTYLEDATISPVRNENGEIINFVAVKKDVTREVALEQQLVQAKRLESTAILAAGVAHEINTPIQYVLTNTHFFQEALADLTKMQQAYRDLASAITPSGEYEPQLEAIRHLSEEIGVEELVDETNEAITQALNGLQRISDTVSALKSFAEPSGFSKKAEDLNAIILSAVKVSQYAWQDYAEVDLELADNLPRVPLIADRFKQVLFDMISNSAQSLEEKAYQSDIGKGKIHISTKREGENALICITDTGVGIPGNVIDKIFDPFFTTKDVGKGSGQGLSTAHGVIVDDHGGTIQAESVPGESATFTLSLPLY